MSNQRTMPTEATPSKPAKRWRGEKAASVKASKPVLPEAASVKPASSRAARAAERRQAIIDAAMDEFIARGFRLSRSDLAWARVHARPDRTRHRARRDQTIGARALSADCRGARDHRRDLEKPIRETFAARRERNVSRPSRPDLWRTEDDMTSSRRTLRVLTALALAAMLAGCNETKNPGFQGWVEADMIFVSPDESGRVTTLSVREGDEVKSGTQLYSVDDDLQLADLNHNKATLANAQQTYDRAASLSKTGSATQANLDAAVSALRVAEARVNAC